MPGQPPLGFRGDMRSAHTGWTMDDHFKDLLNVKYIPKKR
jgi:hypothetical protein